MVTLESAYEVAEQSGITIATVPRRLAVCNAISQLVFLDDGYLDNEPLLEVWGSFVDFAYEEPYSIGAVRERAITCGARMMLSAAYLEPQEDDPELIKTRAHMLRSFYTGFSQNASYLDRCSAKALISREIANSVCDLITPARTRKHTSSYVNFNGAQALTEIATESGFLTVRDSLSIAAAFIGHTWRHRAPRAIIEDAPLGSISS